jgi:hypothetical protein
MGGDLVKSALISGCVLLAGLVLCVAAQNAEPQMPPTQVRMADVAPLVNTRGPLFVHPKGIVTRTHSHVMSM